LDTYFLQKKQFNAILPDKVSENTMFFKLPIEEAIIYNILPINLRCNYKIYEALSHFKSEDSFEKVRLSATLSRLPVELRAFVKV